MSDIGKLKELLEIPESDSSEDTRLRLLLDRAGAFMRSYCREDVIREDMAPVLLAMAAEDYGRIGGEGLSFRSFSGASESYRGGYSEGIMASLRRFRRVGWPN